MASSALRLRRALSFSSALAARSTATATATATSASIIHRSPLSRFTFPSPPSTTTSPISKIGSRCVHSTSLSLSASRSYNQGNDEINEDTILFEGCDYKHWLITMDFPKDPAPSPEEMIETYVQTLAKVVGSVEEAKKRMYACSTTTYTGFQAEMDEETSQKFEGLPGVVFILPDSYIDPVNKEYGGDKYINGTIIPRPPPVQYGRARRPRGYQDSNFQQQNHGQQQNFQQQNLGERRNFQPQQNYGPPQDNHGPMPNYPPRDNLGPRQNYPPRDNLGPRQSYPPRDNLGPRQSYPPQQGYAPPQNDPPRQSFSPPRQGERMDPMPAYNQGNYNQGGGYPSENRGDFGQNQSFDPPPHRRQFGQGGLGSYGQNQAGNEYGTIGSHGQGANHLAYGQGYADHPHGQQNIPGQNQQSNYPPMGQRGRD